MQSATATLPELTASSRPESFRDRFIEFLLMGGVTLALFPLAWIFERGFGISASEAVIDAVAFHAAVVINNPHFAVTYLLFYNNARERAFGRAFPPGQRARYLFAGLVVPVALFVWACAALSAGSSRTMGFMIELMFFLVGWHYVKQGFGILTVFSARRGFFWSPFLRRVLLAHCFAGWAYAWASPSAPSREVEEKGVVYMALPHPPALELVTKAAFFLSAIALAAALAAAYKRDRKAPPLAPLAGFLITIWLWTVYTSLDRLMLYIIPALHSIQYIFVVWLLKRNEAREAEGPPLFGRPTVQRLAMLAASAIGLGWILFRGAPALLDGALVMKASAEESGGGLGDTPYFAAIFVFVNIHHYFMDYVIWRRENPETRYLREPSRPAAGSLRAADQG